jgi:hypothetical protein
MVDFSIPKEFPVGATIRDRLSGATGKVGGYMKRINGCIQVLLVPQVTEGGTDTNKQYYYDQPLLEVLDASTAIDGLGAPDFPIKFDIGTQVVDPVSGYEGIVTEISLAANGCFDCNVTSKGQSLFDGPSVRAFDHRRLEQKFVVAEEGAKPKKAPKVKTGATSGGCAPMLKCS